MALDPLTTHRRIAVDGVDADFLARFAAAKNLERYALYLHDYGSQIGLRLAIQAPERVAALIIQNGDIYEDQLGRKYHPLKDYWANPTPGGRAKLVDAVSEEGFRDEFLNEVRDDLIDRLSPDLWTLAWTTLPTLIMWGPQDGYMLEGAARAYLRDLADAELHLLDGGHWALETNLGEVVALARDFLGRVHSAAPSALAGLTTGW